MQDKYCIEITYAVLSKNEIYFIIKYKNYIFKVIKIKYIKINKNRNSTEGGIHD